MKGLRGALRRFRLTPSLPFTRFNATARAAVGRAQAEAARLDHNYIGTEHLVLGLLGDDGSAAGKLLGEHGLTLEGGRAWLERHIGRGAGAPTGEIGLTPRSRWAIERSVDAAARERSDEIDDRHLLLGVLTVADGLAAGMITEAGIDAAELRRAAEAVAETR